MKRGIVYLVGAGPGAPGLITVRGLECLRSADVVLYDHLCNPFLLREAPLHARRIFAGKHAGARSLTQKRIETLMLHHARKGRKVVRLKGGDPFLFGRGAEEAQYLHKHKIMFEIVPGVTSAIAVPAYAGIPVTHRHYASGVAMITAQENLNKSQEALDYPSLAKFPGSLVVLMAVKSLEEVSQKLLVAGKPPDTPAAVICSGTRGFQQTIVSRLDNIVECAREVGLRPPAVAVIGDVVKCRQQLKWFEHRPLFGKRIVVTRTREQASEVSAQLWELGAEVLELPTIEIQRVHSAEVHQAVRRISEWDWIVFTSPWAVDFFLESILEERGDLRVLRKARFAVVGPTTASKLQARGLRWDFIPKIHTAEALATEIKKRIPKIQNSIFKRQPWKVLLPRSEIGGNIIEKAFREIGATVHAVTIYRNIQPKLTWEIEALERIGVDMVTFTSSSIAENFVRLLKSRNALSVSAKKMLRTAKFISVGPSTSATLRRLGLQVHAEARTSTIQGLIRCLKSLAN